MNRFDTILWRINGVFLLGLCIAGGLVFTYALYEIVKDKTRDRSAGDLIRVESGVKTETSLHYGGFQRVAGTDLFMGAVLADQRYDRSYFSKSAGSIRNYVFCRTGESPCRRLLATDAWMILETYRIRETPDIDDPAAPVIGFLFQIVQNDTDGNGLINAGDNHALYRSDPDGGRLIGVLSELEDIITVRQIDERTAAVFFTRNGRTYIAGIDHHDGRVLRKTPLPNLGNKQEGVQNDDTL